MRLTHHKRIDSAVLIARRAHNCGTNRVGAHRQTTGGLKFDAVTIEQIEHHLTDQTRRFVMQGDTAQVDVVVGFFPGGKSHFTAHHGKLGDELAQTFAGFFDGQGFGKFSHISSLAGYPGHGLAVGVQGHALGALGVRPGSLPRKKGSLFT